MRTIALLALFAAAVIAVPNTPSSQETVQLYRRKYVKDSDRDVDSKNEDRDDTKTPPATPDKDTDDKSDDKSKNKPDKYDGPNGGKRRHRRGRFFRRLMRNDKFRKAFWKWWKNTGRQYADEVIKEIKEEGGADHDNLPGHHHNDGHDHDHKKDDDNKDDNNNNDDDKKDNKKYDDKDDDNKDAEPVKKKRTYTRN